MAATLTTSPATYGLLGLLASRSWTGYELTQQVRRSLRFVWPVSEGHLYREQKRLVELGWATVSDEPAGRRTRKRYAITSDGRAALVAWLATEPEEPHLQIEGLLRTFYADQGAPADLAHAARRTALAARSMCDELSGYARDYLIPDGPLELLRSGVGLDGTARLERGGRPVFPERLPSVAVTLDVATALLEQLSSLFDQLADDVGAWDTTAGPALVDDARTRLERAASRGIHPQRAVSRTDRRSP
jgi:DNA-binding PadR family transcriptional regulator